ncbi:hypothetical protein ACMZOO_07635 [Catenovulum sp. SX2]|uniref:hypothetical protein n=1 Tax=Catenovulum sp. SX2 TaxID=3398614 RepID=UPI003F82517E
MKKFLLGGLFTLILSAPAMADKGNVKFDQHLKVYNKTGEVVVVNIQKGKYHDREKKLSVNESDRFKFNDLKETVTVGCGPDGCDNAFFDRSFKFSVRKKESTYWSSCYITIHYKSNTARNKVISRTSSDTCKSSVEISGADGKTIDVKLTGFNI